MTSVMGVIWFATAIGRTLAGLRKRDFAWITAQRPGLLSASKWASSASLCLSNFFNLCFFSFFFSFVCNVCCNPELKELVCGGLGLSGPQMWLTFAKIFITRHSQAQSELLPDGQLHSRRRGGGAEDPGLLRGHHSQLPCSSV